MRQGSVPFDVSRLFYWQSTNTISTVEDDSESKLVCDHLYVSVCTPHVHTVIAVPDSSTTLSTISSVNTVVREIFAVKNFFDEPYR